MMRGYFVVLVLMALVASAGLAASRTHAAPVPKCELKAMKAVFGEIPVKDAPQEIKDGEIKNGDLESTNCEKIGGGAHVFTGCIITTIQGSAYEVVLDYSCDTVKGISRIED